MRQDFQSKTGRIPALGVRFLALCALSLVLMVVKWGWNFCINFVGRYF